MTTRYTMRDEGMYRRIAGYIHTAVSGKKELYDLFPSYRFLENVYEAFLDMGSDVDLIVQSQNMREHERKISWQNSNRSGRGRWPHSA